jgi:hypothetical protein
MKCQIPGVALNGVLEGKVADAVGVGSGLSGRSSEGGPSERERNRSERSLHFAGFLGYIVPKRTILGYGVLNW